LNLKRVMPLNATGEKLVTSRIDTGIDPYRVEELFGLETADPDPVGACAFCALAGGTREATANDRIDHQVVAVGSQFITPAKLLSHAAFVADGPVDLQLEPAVLGEALIELTQFAVWWLPDRFTHSPEHETGSP